MERYFLNRKEILRRLTCRAPETHKGNYGKLLLMCGSKGYTGAAALAAMGALRTGSGLVFLGVPESIYSIEACKLTEPVVIPVPDEAGTFGAGADDFTKSLLADKDAVLVGPGIGRSQGAEHTVLTILENFAGPVVLDADGINAMSRHKDVLRSRTGVTILTPHAGEFQRIGGRTDIERTQAAAELARDLGSIVLLKGHQTVVTDGSVYYENDTGNPGMAVGGSGDVLAGVIVSMLGQGLDALDAAAFGAWLHGAAGDLCAREIGQCGMLPGDIVLALPRLLQ